MPEDFTVIREAQPQNRAGTQSGNRGFPVPPQGHGSHPVPRVFVADPHHAGQHFPTREGGSQPFAPPSLGQHPKANTPVKISDVRNERPPEAEEARELLSEYQAYRFDRLDKDNDHGSRRRKPNWDRVMRTAIPETSKHGIAQTVRTLNKIGESAAEKRRQLTSSQKRQIELTLEELQKYDGHWYQTELVQIDDPVLFRPKEKNRDKERESDRGRAPSRQSQRVDIVYVFKRKPSSRRHRSKTGESKKTTMDSASFTAYFKRSPRPGVDPFMLLQCKDTPDQVRMPPKPQLPLAQNTATIHHEAGRHSQPIPPPPPPPPFQRAPPQVANRSPSPPPQARHSQRPFEAQSPVQGSGQRQPPSPSQKQGPQPLGQWPPPALGKPPATAVQPTPKPGIMKRPGPRELPPRQQQQPPHSRDAPPNIDEPAHSEIFPMRDGDKENCSSSETSFESVDTPVPRHPRYGSHTVQAQPKHHPIHHFPPHPSALGPPPPPVQANPPAAQPHSQPDVTQILSKAYAAGRADSREEAIHMAERIAAAAVSSSPKHIPPSRVIHHRAGSPAAPIRRASLTPPRSGVRHLVPLEILERRERRGSLDIDHLRESRAHLDREEPSRTRISRQDRRGSIDHDHHHPPQRLGFENLDLGSDDEESYSAFDFTEYHSKDNHRRRRSSASMGSSGSSGQYYYVSSSPIREERVVVGERQREYEKEKAKYYDEGVRERDREERMLRGGRLLRDEERYKVKGRPRRDSGVDVAFREEYDDYKPARRVQHYGNSGKAYERRA